MKIAKTARIGRNVEIRDGVTIEDHVVIGDNCLIDYGAIIKENVTIGSNSFVGAQCILGEYLYDFFADRVNHEHPLIIGENALLRSGTIIYGGSELGPHFQTGHRVTIREGTHVGEHVSVGTLSDIQGRCVIGDYVHLHSNVHIGQGSRLGNYVWIFPYVVLTNDPTPPSETLRGVTVDDFACVCTQSVVLPGVHIGKDALVGAGANVTRDIAEGMLAVGNPAKVIKPVRDLLDEHGQLHYPWRYHFDRGTPWQDVGYDQWLKLHGQTDRPIG